MVLGPIDRYITVKNLNVPAIVAINRTVRLVSFYADENNAPDTSRANVVPFAVSDEAISAEDAAKKTTDGYVPNIQFVPDGSTVVRGGKSDLPPIGSTFSAAFGSYKYDAAKWMPHGQMRGSTVSIIRAYGGNVSLKPELSRNGVLKERHVDVVEGRAGAFGEIELNPVPKLDRIG